MQPNVRQNMAQWLDPNAPRVPCLIIWRLDDTTCSLGPHLNTRLCFFPSCYLLRLVSVFCVCVFSHFFSNMHTWPCVSSRGLRWVGCRATVTDFDRWLSQLSGASRTSLSPGEVWHARFRREENSVAALFARTHTQRWNLIRTRPVNKTPCQLYSRGHVRSSIRIPQRKGETTGERLHFSWPLKRKTRHDQHKKQSGKKKKLYLSLHIQMEKRQQCLSDIQGSRWTKKREKPAENMELHRQEVKQTQGTLTVLKWSWKFPISCSPCARSLMFYWYLIVKSQQLLY